MGRVLVILGFLGCVIGCGGVMDKIQERSTVKRAAGVQMDIYSVPNPLSGVTRISVVLPFGAITDPTDKQGVSSLATDLILKGARGFNSTQISERLALYGAEVNIVVGQLYSVLQINVLSEFLEPCLKFLQIILRGPTFPKREFELLKEQYLADIRTVVESNQRMLWHAYRRWYYAQTPLNHYPGGDLKTIQSLTVQDVKQWWKEQFGAVALKIFFTSNLPESQVRQLIEQTLGWVRPVTLPAVPKVASLVTQPKGVDALIINKPDSQTNDFMLAQPSLSFATDKNLYYAAHVANTAFGGSIGMQSRLFLELREKRGWTYHASSGYWGSFYHDLPVPWVVYSFPSLQHTSEAIPMAYQMIKDFLAKGLSSEELELYRTNMIRMYPFTIDTPQKVLDKTFDEVVQGRYRLSQAERESILRKLTHTKIIEALQAYHSDKNFVFLMVGDAGKLKKELSKWFPTVKNIRVIQPEDVL